MTGFYQDMVERGHQPVTQLLRHKVVPANQKVAGFLLVLGIMVDDAIIVGEAVYERAERGHTGADASILATQMVLKPLVASVFVTMIAFAPMMMFSGEVRQFTSAISLVVISTLIFLADRKPHHSAGPLGPRQKANPQGDGLVDRLMRLQQKCAHSVLWVARNVHGPLFRNAVKQRYLTWAVFLVAMILAVGLLVSGRVKQTFMPEAEGEKTDRRIELFLSPMEAMETVILRRVLRRVIHEREGLRGIGFGHIEDIIGLIRQGTAGNRITLPGDIRVIREYSLLVITSEGPHRITEYELAVPGEAVIVGAGLVLTAKFEQSTGQCGDGRTGILLDADSKKLPLTVRTRKPGDRFHPMGFRGTRKVQDFFVDLKVPRDERDRVPIVTSGDDIVWIAGYRADDRFMITEHTKKFLRLGIVKGKF